jgi:hypothetical protein
MTGKRKSAGNVGRAGRSEADLGQKEAPAGKDASRAGNGKRSTAQPYGRRQSGQGRSPAEGEN